MGVERQTGREESELSAGTLFSSGLIAGGSICASCMRRSWDNALGPFRLRQRHLVFHGETSVQVGSGLVVFALRVTARAARKNGIANRERLLLVLVRRRFGFRQTATRRATNLAALLGIGFIMASGCLIGTSDRTSGRPRRCVRRQRMVGWCQSSAPDAR